MGSHREAANEGLGAARCFDVVWYADRQRAESKWKFLVYDFKGELVLGPGYLHFSATELKLDIAVTDVTSVVQREQVFASYLAMCFAGVATCFGVLNGAASDDHPVLYAMMALVVYPVAYFLLQPAMASAGRKAWTVVSYRTDGGAREAWFSDGTRLGWGGRTGDMALYTAIKLQLLGSAQAPAGHHQLPPR